MHLSSFLRYLSENAKFLSLATLAEVKAAARARVIERFQAGRADYALTFNDLFDRCEKEIGPK